MTGTGPGQGGIRAEHHDGLRIEPTRRLPGGDPHLLPVSQLREKDEALSRRERPPLGDEVGQGVLLPLRRTPRRVLGGCGLGRGRHTSILGPDGDPWLVVHRNMWLSTGTPLSRVPQ